MPFSGASPTPNAARLGRQGSISHRQRLLSTAALSVDEEIRRQEGGGFAIPMDSNSPVAGGPIRRLKTDDTEAGLPLHRRRGSLSRQAPDLNLRPPPVISSAARAEAAPPAPVSVDLPPSPSSSTRTFTQAYSLDRAHPPRSPLSTPLSELPAEALVDPFEPASTSFFPPSPGDSVPVGPVPISLPSVLPATDVADDAASPSQRVVPRLHLRTASGADIGLPSIQSLPSLPRGPSGFRLGRRPSVSGSPSPTREVFWGGQAGTARKSSAAVTPVGSDDGQSPLTPGGSVRILRPLPSPRGEFNLDTGKMLTVRARVATPKGERSAFIDATRSCPPLHSPLPSPLSSPTPAPQSDLHADPPAEQDDTDVLALVQRQPAIPVAVAQGSPPEPSRRTSVFSFTSGSSGLSTSSSATAGTSSALDTPSLVDRSILASPKPHLTVSKPPTLLPVEGEPLKPTTTTETAESEPLSPLLDGLRSRQNAARSGESRNGGLRRSSGALKLNLTDNERSVKGPSRFPTLLLGNVRDDELDDLLSACPSSGLLTSESSLSRKSSGPSLVADLRKSSTASYMSFSSVRSEPFAYDDGWSGSDDSDNESIPMPRPRPSFSRSSSNLAPPVPIVLRRSSGMGLAPALALVTAGLSQSDMVDASPNRSSSLPVPLSSPGSSLRSLDSVGTIRPLSQGDPRSSVYSTRSESTYFPSSGAGRAARPSSIFSLNGDGSLVTQEGKVLPRPKLDQVDPWGDVEIAYQSGVEAAAQARISSKGSQASGSSSRNGSSSGRKWEEAADRLPGRKKLLARQESAVSSASSHSSSSGKAPVVEPSRVARPPPSAMKMPAPAPMASAQAATTSARPIPIRKTSSTNQLRSTTPGSSASGATSSRLPSPAIKKSYSGNIPRFRSPAGFATSSPTGLKQPVSLSTIEPLRITRPGASSPQPPAASPLAVKDKPLPVSPSVGNRLSPAPAADNLRSRTPLRSQSEDTTPTQTPVASVGRERTSEPSPSTVQADDALQSQPLAVGADVPLSPKPAFGPAAGRRMSKRPSVPKARPPPPIQHLFYEAPPLPPLPALPAALASQPR